MGSPPCNVHIHSGLHPDELRLELDKLYHHLKELIMATKKEVVDAIEANRAASKAESAALSAKVTLVIKLLTDLRNGGGATATELDEVLGLVNKSGAEDIAGDKAVEDAIDAALAPLTLTSLLVSVGTLSPTFDPAVLSYSVDEAADVTSVMFAATASEPAATLSIAGKDAQSGVPSDPVTLIQGANPVEVRVTRLTSTPPAVVVYTVIVNVAAPADAGDGTGAST